MKSRPAGFTLVEIAIILVILGLLLGGFLKGQEMVFNSKVKATYNLTREVAAAIRAYADRYGALPGDDPQASTRFPAAVPRPVDGNGDGVIAYTDCRQGNGGGEACAALYEMRLAGFLAGDGTTSIRTPLGGSAELGQGRSFVADFDARTSLGLYPAGMTYKAASAIDASFDDGNPATGNWRCNALTTYGTATPDQTVPSWCAAGL
jgi:hypothetical protein